MEGTEYTIELDIFLGEYEGLKLAEVEFPSEEAALAFVPPEWFGARGDVYGRVPEQPSGAGGKPGIKNERIKTKEQYKGILLMIKQVMNWIKTHRYCLAGLYMLVFLSGFFLLELHEPSDVHIIHCAVDDLIPFNEWFVLPYFLWYAWVPVFMLYFMIKGSGGISETLLCDVCRSNLLLICLSAGTKRFKSAAGDHITEFLRADCAGFCGVWIRRTMSARRSMYRARWRCI